MMRAGGCYLTNSGVASSNVTIFFPAEEAAFPQHGRFGHPHPELRTARRRTEGVNCSLNTTVAYSAIYCFSKCA